MKRLRPLMVGAVLAVGLMLGLHADAQSPQPTSTTAQQLICQDPTYPGVVYDSQSGMRVALLAGDSDVFTWQFTPRPGDASWTLSPNAPWLDVTPKTGKGPAVLQVTVNASGQTPGTQVAGAIMASVLGLASGAPVTQAIQLPFVLLVRQGPQAPPPPAPGVYLTTPGKGYTAVKWTRRVSNTSKQLYVTINASDDLFFNGLKCDLADPDFTCP